MANTKISDFASGAPAQATDEFVIARSGANYKLAASDIQTLVNTPAGSDTQIQFNDGGAFGGDAGLTFNKTSKTLTLGGGTVTTSSPVIDASQTWNAGAVTFTGLKFNATDTASASGSLLMDLQVGGSSRLNVNKSGFVSIPTAATASGPSIRLAGVSGAYSRGGAALFAVSNLSAEYFLVSTTSLSSSSGAFRLFNAGQDISTNDANAAILSWRAAANLRLGAADAAAPVAQTLSVQSVVAGTTNTAGANLTITGSQGTGTGAGGSIIFQVAPAGSSGTAQNSLVTFLEATSARAFNLYNTTDVTTNFERGKIAWESNVLRIGTEKGGTGTARALEFQTDGTTKLTIGPTTTISVLATGFFGFLGRSLISSASDGVMRLTNNGVSDFNRLQFGGTTSSFPALKRSTTSLQAVLADDTGFTNIQGKLTTETAYTAGAPTATGYLVLYDSNGTAYKVPAEAL